MSAVLDAVPAASVPSGLPTALTIAFAVTALVAIGFVFFDLRRSGRLNNVTGALTALTGVGVLAAALMVGSVFSQTPPAVAETDTPAVTAVTVDQAESDFSDLQLPSLPLP